MAVGLLWTVVAMSLPTSGDNDIVNEKEKEEGKGSFLSSQRRACVVVRQATTVVAQDLSPV